MTVTQTNEKTETVEKVEEVKPSNVIEAILRVMADLPGIGKTEHSDEGYNYRGIESITRHAQQLFARYGVVFVPRVVDHSWREYQVRSGATWTEQHLSVTYTVYGPSHGQRVDDRVVQDFVMVGPIHALGRDPSDKGINKCMTQAFKYALLQVLCIGDAADDADREQVVEQLAPPTPPQPVDEAKALRDDIGRRARALPAGDRATLRQFCEVNGIPNVPAKMDDDQCSAVVDWLDEWQMAEDDRERGPSPDPETPSEAPHSPPEARQTGEGMGTPKLDLGLPTEAQTERPSLEAIIAAVGQLSPEEVDVMLEERGIPKRGNEQTRRLKLATDLHTEAPARPGA